MARPENELTIVNKDIERLLQNMMFNETMSKGSNHEPKYVHLLYILKQLTLSVLA